MDPSRVEKQMVLEIAEIYYATKTFYFDYHELYLMHKFLTIDCFGLNIRPADFVRSIEIVVDENFKCRCNANALFLHKLLPSEHESPETAIKECLDQLFYLKMNLVSIKIVIFSQVLRARRLERQQELLQILHPVLCELDRRGHHIVLESYSGLGSEWILDGFSEMSLEHLLCVTMGATIFINH